MSSQLHDIIALGASAGGVDALCRIVAGLPPNLGASVDIQDSLEEKEEFQAAQAETIRRTLLALYGTGGDRA